MPHIPTLDTRSFSDISFYAHLEAALLPSADYDVSKWLFVPNTYTEYRYILGTLGKKPLITARMSGFVSENILDTR